MPNQNKPEYNVLIGCTSEFFVPHSEANHLNAQDVIHELVASAKDISIATFIRQTILDQCKKVLGKEGFNEIMANQLNSVKPKKEKE